MVVEEWIFYCFTYQSREKMFLNIIYKIQGPYKNVKSVTFGKLMTGLFHQHNLNSCHSLNTFVIALCTWQECSKYSSLYDIPLTSFAFEPLKSGFNFRSGVVLDNSIRLFANWFLKWKSTGLYLKMAVTDLQEIIAAAKTISKIFCSVDNLAI